MAHLLVGTEDGLVEVDGSRRRELDGHRVTALSGAGWAIVDGTTVMHRIPPGGWHKWLEFGDAGSGHLTCLAPRGDEVFVGTSGGQLMRHRRDESPHLQPVPSFDTVDGRQQWHAVGSSKPYVRSITATADGVLLANVHVGGIPRSTDGGQTWHPTIDVDADVHQVRAHPERPELVLAAAAVGLCVSRDGGVTWTVQTEGLHATYCRAVAVAGDAMLVSASTGPFTDRGAIYRRSLDGDGPFERVSDWLDGNVDSGRLVAFSDQVAFGDPDGRLHFSDDYGATWTVRDDVPPVTALAYSRT
ncbi:MAG: WD40/YVTN/BNR-like repeat-containing protein [Acidimicrobiia bacterium]